MRTPSSNFWEVAPTSKEFQWWQLIKQLTGRYVWGYFVVRWACVGKPCSSLPCAPWKDLIHDLKSELTGNFENLVLSMMMSSAHFDASELREAIKVRCPPRTLSFLPLLVKLGCASPQAGVVHASGHMFDSQSPPYITL